MLALPTLGYKVMKMSEKKKKITTIEELPGVGDTTAAKLRDAGYDSLEIIAVSLPAELAEVAGIGEGTAAKAVIAARDALEMGYETADIVLERRKNIQKITTGSKELDNLLGGGIETMNITEGFGRFSSGKSQIAFQLCVNVQLPKDKGGLEAGALFIDTESTFRPERIAQMTITKGLDVDTVLKNIVVARAHTSDHQTLLVEKAAEIIKEKNIKLLIIDSLMSGFRSEYAGRGQLAERQQKLNKHIHDVQKLAEIHNVAVYVTNQVMDRPDIMFGDPTAPVGGNIVAHASGVRMYLRRSKENRRIAKIVDSPHLPEGECVFTVSEDGIGDAE